MNADSALVAAAVAAAVLWLAFRAWRRLRARARPGCPGGCGCSGGGEDGLKRKTPPPKR